MGGSHNVTVREANWESMVHGNFVGARSGGAQKMDGAPIFNDRSVAIGGTVGGN